MEINDDLKHLLIEIHERMYSMMEYCERLQPVKLDLEDHFPTTVDLTDVEEMIKTKLFRLDDEMVDEDQTTRSILKDLRKYINN